MPLSLGAIISLSGPPCTSASPARPACRNEQFRPCWLAIRASKMEQMANPNKSAILVHNERTGGNSIHQAIGSIYHGRIILLNSPKEFCEKKGRIVAALSDEPYYIAGHVPLLDFRGLMEGSQRENMIVFSCIRDPIERIVSLYKFNLRVPGALGPVHAATTGRGFAYFYSYMAEKHSSMVMNSQCRYLSGGGFVAARMAIETAFDAVADLSRINDLVSYVAKLSGGEITAPAPKLNSNADSASDPDVLQQFVGPALRRKMENDNTEDLVLREHLLRDHDGLFRSNYSADKVEDTQEEPATQDDAG
ncbi:sulfotransferase family 2 domain-containing protein [Methylobacterium sp. R2-1]|uniref:sulfotransferase family 2 domain-containing protein n=1 Tax=Methylobacterium sp. R2-1 TaxID=2587064 RepID=UPI00161EB015|nr:sulfotransferase family 2 domain-containing protein [Methylobacterium sp. R2-1]MBB2961784.1 hypothetical protein [Methylobacterium sp. R2-1]